jgi:hypothetical protein
MEPKKTLGKDEKAWLYLQVPTGEIKYYGTLAEVESALPEFRFTVTQLYHNAATVRVTKRGRA